MHGVLRLPTMPDFKIKAGPLQRPFTPHKGNHLPLRYDLSRLLQQLGSIAGDSEGMISMVDDHNIPKTFEPIGIEPPPRQNGSNLGPLGGLDFNSVLPLFFE